MNFVQNQVGTLFVNVSCRLVQLLKQLQEWEAKAKYDDIAEQIESKKAKRELFKGFIRTWEQSCAGSDCEIQGRYKIHIQERI